MNKCSHIDGIASSEAIDSSGEIVSLAGLDISSLVNGPLNWEHTKDSPSSIVGKILEAEKIFSKEDCKNDRHKYYWDKCKIPFLYIMGRLFDDEKNPKPSSVEVAALFKDDAAHPNEQDMVGFSIEGAKLEKINSIVTHSIARKTTITIFPCNKTCLAELLPIKKESEKNDLDSLFKGEMELFKFEPTYQEIMAKKEDLKKDVGSGGGAFIGSSLAMSEKSNKKELKKALTAGSGMAAPGQLEGGAALASEDMSKKMHKKEKTNWSERADKAYDSWSDREKFNGYMKKRMPHLADGEIKAIGRILALKKDMDTKGSMSKMYASHYSKSEKIDKTTDIMMASENKSKK